MNKFNQVEYISVEDVPQHPNRKGRPLAPHLVAVRTLEPGMAIRFPCHYGHNKKRRECGGRPAVYLAAKNEGFKVHTRCMDKVFYVWRDSEEEK